MQKFIESLTRARLFALLVTICATGQAWAAITATEVWEADQIKENYNSGTGLITGCNNSVYKLNVGSGLVVDDTSGAFTLGSDGSITVNSTATHGATIDLTATGSNPTTISILVKYRSLSACSSASLISAFMTRNGSKPECGLIQTENNALSLKPYWYIASNSSGYNFNINTPSVSTSGGYLLFSYDRNNIKGYTGSALNSMSGGSAAMAWTALTFQTAAIGGSSGEVTDSSFNNKWPNMVIEKIALFVGNAYTGSDLAAYVFPSEDPSSSYDYIKTITANTALSEITSWEKGIGTPGPDAKVYIICENDAVFTIDDDLEVEKLWVDGGSIALADGASIGSAEVLGAPITVAAATSAAISDSTVLSAITANGALNVSGSELRNTITCNGTMSVTGTSTISGAVTCNGTMSVSGNSTISGAVSGSGSNNSMTIANTTVTGAISCSDHFTLNIRDSAINGGITAAQNGQATINTYGTVSFGSSANNDFKYSNSFNIKSGTTTYNSSGDQKLWCNITVDTGATLVNAKQDSLNYSQNAGYPIHVYIRGTLTMNQKWTLGSVDRIHLYDGALINGNAANAIHPNQSGGKGYIIAEDGTSVITASVANGNATIDLTVNEGATLSMISTPTIASRSGSGLLLKRVADNTRWDGSGVPTNYNGVELYSSGSHGGNDDETFLNSSYTDYIKVTTADGDFRSFGYVVAGDFTNPVFSDRPTLELAGDMRVYQSTADKPLTVKNLSGTGDVRNYNDSDNLTYKHIDTLQTKNTTYSGGFKNIDSCSDCDPALTVRGADNAAAIYALTLSGVNDTTAPLTIDNNAKVIFPSSGGSWASGAVTVADGGYLETQSATALGAVTLQDGATIVIPTVSDAVVPLTGTTVTLPTSGTVEVDLSGVSAEVDDVVTVISATTLVNANASIFSARGWQFSVDENSIKATKLGTLTWSSGSWSDNNFAGYTAAAITASGTQDVTLPASATIDLLTLTGSGTVTLKPTSSEALTVSALSIGSGVTLNASSSLVLAAGCTISGDGTLNIPSGVTLVMDGVGCSAKVTVSGTLETSGTTELSAANTSAQGSLLHIVGGATTLASAWKGIAGNITIDYGATLTMGASYNGASNTYWEHFSEQSSTCVDIGGTLNMGGYIWFFGANNSVKLRSRAEVYGSGRSGSSSYGNWVWMNDGPADGALHAYGNATIDLTINTIEGKSPRFEIDAGATLEIRKDFTPQDGEHYAGGSITKAGAGTLKFTQETLTKPITINAGKVQLRRAFTSGLAISIAEGAELELGVGHGNTDINTTALSFAGVTGSGTIRYSSQHSGYYTEPISAANMFATTLHVANDNAGKGVVIPWSGGVTTNRTISGSGKYRTDWSGSSGVADRYFLALQDADSEWSGIFHENDRLYGMKVAGVEGAANKTLTLSGTQEQTNTLEVEPTGSVNLTGAWVGDTTVSGEFGGTGSITGALTLSAGSTFKVWATGGLTVTGALTLPEEEEDKITVDASDLTIGAQASTTILTVGSGMDLSKFNLVGSNTHFLQKSGQVLNLVPIAARLINGNTTTKFAGVDEALGSLYLLAGSNSDAYVTVTPGFSSGFTDEELLETYGIFHDSINNIFGFAAVKIASTTYVSLSVAVAAASDSGDTVTLLRNVAETGIDLDGKAITLDEDEYTFSGSFTGTGTLIMTTLPKSLGASLWAAGWTGTLWLKNVTFNDGLNPGLCGNANSTLKMTGCQGKMNETFNTGNTFTGTLELEDDGATVALTLTAGYPVYGFTQIGKLKGSGTLKSSGSGGQCFNFADPSQFTGSIDIGDSSALRVVLGDNTNEGSYKKIIVRPNTSVSIGETSTWNAPGGITVNGTVNVANGGTITGTITGSGTVAYTTSAPAPTLANNWTGTIWFKSISDFAIDPASYGTSNSKLKFTGVTATIASGTTFASEVVLADDGDTKALTIDCTTAYAANTIQFSKLSGSGTLVTSSSNSQYPRTNFRVSAWSDFVGSLDIDRGRVIFGTDNISTDDWRYIYVSEGATATVAVGKIWKATEGFVVNGELDCNGGKLYGTGAAGTLKLAGSGLIVNTFEGGSSQCFNAGVITVSGSVEVKMVGGWSNFGTWVLTETASLGIDPGTDNDYWINSTIASASKNNTINIYGNGVHPVVDNAENGTTNAAIRVYNGGIFQVSTAAGDTDRLRYENPDTVGGIMVEDGGQIIFKSRETYTRHTTLNGGTFTLDGVQSSRSIDFFKTLTVAVTDDSTIEATGAEHWMYLRGGTPTFNVSADKTLTVNAGFTYADQSKQDLIKAGAGTMVVNGYVDGSGNHESFSQPKGVIINAGTYELNAVQTSNGQTGDAANFYTVASGAKLKVGSTGQVNTSTLTLNDGSQLEFGVGNATLINASTVTFASGTTSVAFSSGVTPTDDTTLLTWSSAPDGTFTLADDAIAANFRLVKDGSGLKIAAIVKIDNTSSVEVGYIDASGAAVITNTVGTILLSSTTTTANFYPNSTEEFAFNGATGLQNYNVYVKYIDGNKVEQTQNIYGLFTLGIVDAQAGNYKLTLNPNGTAAVNAETIYLKPALRAGNSDPSPMAYTGEDDLKFNVKAIPGLYYAVKAYSSPACADGDLIGSGEAKQAISATVSPEAPAIGAATVQYYKVAVGLAEDEVSPTP